MSQTSFRLFSASNDHDDKQESASRSQILDPLLAKEQKEEDDRVDELLQRFMDIQTKSKSRVLQDNLDREQKQFLDKESSQYRAKQQPLSDNFNLETYESV